MITITRKGLTLSIDSSVIPAQGSSNVPVKFINDNDEYENFKIQLYIGWYNTYGLLKSTVCIYDNGIFHIPSEAFAQAGFIYFSIGLVDPLNQSHIEKTLQTQASVSPAPVGTVILPSEDNRKVNALNELFKICAFTQNPSNKYNEFLQAFGIGGLDPIESWKVTNNLTNVINSNNAYYVIKGNPYSATLKANEGYSINSVIIEMGGDDVTNTVYSDGNINISSVTGDVVITAFAEASQSTELPQEGLLGMFDFRNATDEQYNLTSWGNVYKINSPENKTLLAFSTSQISNSDKYGIDKNYKVREFRRIDNESSPLDLGNKFTVLVMTYGDCVGSSMNYLTKSNLSNQIYTQARYKNNTNQEKYKQDTADYSIAQGKYSIITIIVDDKTLKYYGDGENIKTVESNELDDFKVFKSSPVDATVNFGDTGKYLTAVAIYDRALSDIEVVELVEYMKTLEVNE